MLNLLTKENVTIYQQRRPETLKGFFLKTVFFYVLAITFHNSANF